MFSGKKKAKRQYEQSLHESYIQEQRLLEQLIEQKQAEHAKVALKREEFLEAKQKETGDFFSEKVLSTNRGETQERIFESLRQRLIDNMQLIRASLYACMTGNLEVVGALIDRGLLLRLTFFKLNPLHIAAENNQVEVIKFLCRHGVDSNRLNKNGDSALGLAEAQNNKEAILLLKDIAKLNEQLWLAVKDDNPEQIKLAIEQGADINATDGEEYNALQLAIIHRQNYEAITFLIKAGADFFHQDNKLNKNALALADEHSDIRVKAFIALAYGVEENGNAWLMVPQNKQLLVELPGYESLIEGLRTKEEIQTILNKSPLILKENIYVQSGHHTAKALKEGGYDKTYRAHHQERYRTGGYPYDAIGMQKFAEEEYGYERAVWEDQYNSKLVDLHKYYVNHGYAYQAEGVKQYLAEFIFKQVAMNESGDNQIFIKPELFSSRPLFSKEDVGIFSKIDLILQEHPYVQRGYHTAKGIKEQGYDKKYRADYQERYRTGGYPYDARGMQKFADEEYGYERAALEYQDKTTLIYLYQHYLTNGYRYQAEGVRKYLTQFILKEENPKTRLENEKSKDFLQGVLKHSQALLMASEQADLNAVKEYLSKGADINSTDEQGNNALQKAIIAKTVTLEVTKVLIDAGIDLSHKNADGKTALDLAKEHGVSITNLVEDPVMGFNSPWSHTDMKARFQEHCDKTQRFLDKYSDDDKKLWAITAYYAWLSKTAPYAIYVWPMLYMLSQLEDNIIARAQKGLPGNLALEFSKKVAQMIAAVQTLFVETRAMHCLLNELNEGQARTLLEEPGFKEAWSFVVNSVELKQKALEIANQLDLDIDDSQVIAEVFKSQESLLLEGTRSFIKEVLTEIMGSMLGLSGEELNEKIALQPIEEAVQLLVKEQQNTLLKRKVEEVLVDDSTDIIQEAVDSEIIQLPSKKELTKSIKGWEVKNQNEEANITQKEEELVREKEALKEWLTQRETEYLNCIKQIDKYIQETYQVDNEINAHFQKAYSEISQDFSQYRVGLEHNYHETKRKINKTLTKNFIAIGAAALLAPMLAPSLSGALAGAIGVAEGTTTMATLTLMVEGALTGALSSAFSGNTGGILKNSFIGGWVAGFGSIMGGILEKSTTIQNLNKLFPKGQTVINIGKESITRGVVTKTLVSGMTTAIHVGLEGGKLSDSLLTSIGTTLALGGSKELSPIEKINEQLSTVLISSTITSAVTHSNFLENTLMIGATDVIQSIAGGIGNQIAKQISNEQARRSGLRENKAEETLINESAVDKTKNEVARSSRSIPRKEQITLHKPSQSTMKTKENKVLRLHSAESKSSTRYHIRQKKETQSTFGKVVNKAFSLLTSAFIGDAHAEENLQNNEALFTNDRELEEKLFASKYLPSQYARARNRSVDIFEVDRNHAGLVKDKNYTLKGLKKPFDTAVDEASRILALNDIKVPRDRIIRILKTHPDLKISKKGIEDSLVKLGWVGSNETGLPSDRKDAFIRGVQQFVYQNRNKFIKNSEGYSGTSTEKQVMEPINPDNIVQKIKEINEFFEVIMPRDFADMADDILHKRSHNDLGEDFDDKVSKTLKSTFEGVKGKFVETGEFIGEEIARLHLGEKTKTRQRLEDINIFLEEEKERFDTGKTTKTGQALKDFGSYLKKEGELIISNEKTQTEQFVRDTYQNIKDMPAEEIGHGVGKLGGETLIGFGIFKGASTLVNGTGKVVNTVKTSKRSVSLAEVKLVKESLLKEKTISNPKPIVTQYNNHNANNANAQKALNKKMEALQKAQKLAVKIEELPDGRVRYYAKERLAKNQGITHGSSYVTEYNSKTGQVRSWIENYNHDGSVNRVHPKMIDGQDVNVQHYPPTGLELKSFTKKLGDL